MPKGVLTVNLIEITRSHRLLDALLRTVVSVFSQRLVYRTDALDRAQMVTLFASDAPVLLQRPARGPRTIPGLNESRWLRSFALPVAATNGPLLLDDRNAFDVLYAPVALEWRMQNADLADN